MLESNTISENKVEDTNAGTPSKIIILDTSNFIKLKPLNLSEGWKYYTTSFIVNEIRDEQARDFYNLNKDFIEVKNPSRESMKHISTFAKMSNDLGNLSIPDLSILALAYDLVKSHGKEGLLRSEPMKYEIVERVQKVGRNKPVFQGEVKKEEDDGFVVVKSKKKGKVEEKKEEEDGDSSDDEDDWITQDNIDIKINNNLVITDGNSKVDNSTLINTFISSADYTVQNVALKMGIPMMSIDGLIIKRIKNYIFKCYTCNQFVFDTTKLFCESCGYNTLMKIGCSSTSDGKMIIFDKQAEARNRGTQYDLPKPSLDKKAVVYILSEDQLPKRKIDVEKDLDKILDNYEGYKDFKPNKINDMKTQNTTKNFVWGYPKKNPNVPKKYYAKKQKK